MQLPITALEPLQQQQQPIRVIARVSLGKSLLLQLLHCHRWLSFLTLDVPPVLHGPFPPPLLIPPAIKHWAHDITLVKHQDPRGQYSCYSSSLIN